MVFSVKIEEGTIVSVRQETRELTSRENLQNVHNYDYDNNNHYQEITQVCAANISLGH